MTEIFSLDPIAYRERMVDAVELQPPLKASALLYNPFGKYLARNMTPKLVPIFAVLHNLDGYMKLVSLQLAIREGSADGNDTGGLIKSACPGYCNPYTGLPMDWDSEKLIISFDGYFQKRPLTVSVRI